MAKKDLINRDNNEPRPSRGQLALRIIFGKTMPQKMFRAYLLAIVIGAILLYLPISLQHGHQIYTYQTDTREDSLVPSGKSYTF
ncbi:hypothetical protein FACS1894166_04000 [Bacilli bacterium]|nr:hypothetical protein FACS1894166_04000 [Bacilli bacterium]